jgi:hypothetical protein
VYLAVWAYMAADNLLKISSSVWNMQMNLQSQVTKIAVNDSHRLFLGVVILKSEVTDAVILPCKINWLTHS